MRWLIYYTWYPVLQKLNTEIFDVKLKSFNQGRQLSIQKLRHVNLLYKFLRPGSNLRNKIWKKSNSTFFVILRFLTEKKQKRMWGTFYEDESSLIKSISEYYYRRPSLFALLNIRGLKKAYFFIISLVIRGFLHKICRF